MHSLRKIFCHSPGHYIGAGVLTVALGLFRYFTLPEGVSVWFACYEIFSLAGCATILIAMLVTLAYFGAFDLFGFVFGGNKRKYRDYADYSVKRTEARERDGFIFVPYYVVGLAVLLISYLFA